MMTRILIVEDDSLVLELHRQFVSTMEGFTVAGTATGGSQALEFLENNPVDCLLLDIFMPDFDRLRGWSVMCRFMASSGFCWLDTSRP